MSKKLITGVCVALILIAIYFGIKMYASNVAEKKIAKAIASLADYVDVNYRKVSVDLLGLDVHISDVLVSPANAKEKVKINEIVIYDVDQNSEVPTFLNLSLNGIEADLNEFGSKADGIRKLGYNDKLLLNVKIEYDYNKEKKELSLKQFKVGADDVGDIGVNIHLGNIDLSTEKIGGIIFTWPQIMLHEAKIGYEDHSLVGRLLKLAAKNGNINVNDFRTYVIQEIEKEIEKEKDEFNRNALKEMRDFIEHPEQFSISISPPEPLPLGRIISVNDPKDIIKLLNMKIES